jgi:hypothetical protein
LWQPVSTACIRARRIRKDAAAAAVIAVAVAAVPAIKRKTPEEIPLNCEATRLRGFFSFTALF